MKHAGHSNFGVDFTCFIGALISSLMFLSLFMTFILTHTVEETNSLIAHKELSYHYSKCQKKSNVNCATITLEVTEFNKNLISNKYYNKTFDLLYSDEVAALPIIR